MNRDDKKNGPEPAPEGVRLNRFLARAGAGSRRGVEDLIRAGRVRVDGRVVTDLSTRVDPGANTVDIDGRTLNMPTRWRVFAFNKPIGVVCTLTAQDKRACLSDYRDMSDLPANLIPVGRLDADTGGLLIWTDDGDLGQALCRPDSKVWKHYELELDAALDPGAIPALRDGGIELDGRPCRPAQINPLGPGGLAWSIRIREGRNRQIRRMFESVGRRVVRLRRVAYGPIDLGDLEPGRFRELDAEEISKLRATIDGVHS